MNNDLETMDAQIKHLYKYHYLPWAAGHGMFPPQTYVEFRKDMLDDLFKEFISAHEDDEPVRRTDRVMVGPNMKVVVLPSNAQLPESVSAFFVAERVSKKHRYTRFQIGGAANRKKSEMRKCMQCASNVWIAKEKLEEADKSEGIVCLDCIPEVAGIPVDQFLAMLRGSDESR